MRWWLLLLLMGCGGTRHVARPATPDGYKSVAVRDIPAVGMKGVNVEVVGVLGPMVPQEVCNGLVTYPLMESNGGSGITGIAVATSGITISFPRSRYLELRDLRPFDTVRVRGYLSEYFAEGCGWYSTTTDRYLWVDTVEKVSLTP